MAETELTKAIKKAIVWYKPEMTSKRTIRYAEEVDVGTGFVDVIRFEDYPKEDNSFCRKEREGLKCKIEGCKFPCESCKGCVYKRNDYVLDILTTCYEVKISKSDFKSKNGHNFVGNRNYYVVPKELFPKILDLVPDNIGIIVYLPSGNLRTKKECIHQEIKKEELSRYLFNALKKWVDRDNLLSADAVSSLHV